jgi:putative peptidoglycan lipid II flippase
LAQSIAIAALPTFAAQVAKNRLDEMRASLSATVRVLLLLAVPASIGLILLRRPLVALLYQGDQFSANSTALVAWALLFYALGLVGHSLVEILSRAFYALHDTKTPVFVGVGAMTLNLGLSFVFAWLFGLWGWMPHGGLALANSVATLIESLLLLILMRKRLQGLEEGKLLLAFIKALIAGAGMTAIILLFNRFLNLPGQLVSLGVAVAAGIASYGLLLIVLKAEELSRIYGLVRGRFARR